MNSGCSEDRNKNKKWYKKKEIWIILFGCFVAGFAISVPFLIMYFTKQPFKIANFANLGVIGDYFGGTTVGLLSLSSIIFVTAAIIMQKEELELQREEVKKTREEYEITNKTMKIQQFDNTFFNMIQLHNDILNSIQISTAITRYDRVAKRMTREDVVYNSRAAIESLYNKLNNSFKDIEDYDKLRDVYEDFYKQNQNAIGHYYRNMYRIIKYIISRNLEPEDESFYIGVMRAQLSSYELLMLFYNISYSGAGEKFKGILKGKAFFQTHLPMNMLINGKIDESILLEIEGKQ